MTLTLQEHVAQARARLTRAGIDRESANLDAEVLARHVLGWTRSTYVSRRACAPHASFGSRYASLIARREDREPVALITGRREFWGLEFDVTPDVLIPRPETELLVEETLAVTPDRDRPFLLVDAGTGCGCLAITLALAFHRARVIATDVSPAALEVAARNAARHGVGNRIEWLCTNFVADIEGRPDVIVSNPPYVPARHVTTLQPEVRDYEPAMALDGGNDGMDALRELITQSESRLTRGGVLIVEFGFGQEEALSVFVRERSRLALMKVRRDLQGLPRVAVLRRPGPLRHNSP